MDRNLAEGVAEEHLRALKWIERFKRSLKDGPEPPTAPKDSSLDRHQHPQHSSQASPSDGAGAAGGSAPPPSHHGLSPSPPTSHNGLSPSAPGSSGVTIEELPDVRSHSSPSRRRQPPLKPLPSAEPPMEPLELPLAEPVPVGPDSSSALTAPSDPSPSSSSQRQLVVRRGRERSRRQNTAVPVVAVDTQPRRRVPARLDVMRVNQSDAEHLDSELLFMLKWQFNQIFKHVQGNFLDRFSPEIDAGLSFLIWRFSVYNNKPSEGNSLQNLRYRDEWNSTLSNHVYEIPRWRRVAHGFFAIGVGRWAWSRLLRKVTNEGYGGYPQGSWQLRLYKLIRFTENLYQFMYIVNYVNFLYSGKYRSVVDRMLGMRLVYQHNLVSRQVSFEFMNQQLVWSSMSEFLLFILPLINLRKLRNSLRGNVRAVSQWWNGKTKKTDSGAGASAVAGIVDGIDPAAREELTELERHAQSPCPICGTQPIVTPFVSNCGHVFCYYCLRASRLAERSQYRCPVCNKVIFTQFRYAVGMNLESLAQSGFDAPASSGDEKYAVESDVIEAPLAADTELEGDAALPSAFSGDADGGGHTVGHQSDADESESLSREEAELRQSRTRRRRRQSGGGDGDSGGGGRGAARGTGLDMEFDEESDEDEYE